MSSAGGTLLTTPAAGGQTTPGSLAPAKLVIVEPTSSAAVQRPFLDFCAATKRQANSPFWRRRIHASRKHPDNALWLTPMNGSHDCHCCSLPIKDLPYPSIEDYDALTGTGTTGFVYCSLTCVKSDIVRRRGNDMSQRLEWLTIIACDVYGVTDDLPVIDPGLLDRYVGGTQKAAEYIRDVAVRPVPRMRDLPFVPQRTCIEDDFQDVMRLSMSLAEIKAQADAAAAAQPAHSKPSRKRKTAAAVAAPAAAAAAQSSPKKDEQQPGPARPPGGLGPPPTLPVQLTAPSTVLPPPPPRIVLPEAARSKMDAELESLPSPSSYVTAALEEVSRQAAAGAGAVAAPSSATGGANRTRPAGRQKTTSRSSHGSDNDDDDVPRDGGGILSGGQGGPAAEADVGDKTSTRTRKVKEPSARRKRKRA